LVNGNKIEGILARLKDYVQKLNYLSTFAYHDLVADFTKLESAKHLLQVSVECCLDVSNHLIASEGLRSPKSYAEAFQILAEQGIVPTSFLPALLQMARFRNRLVHLYWELDEKMIYDILQHNLGDFDAFARCIMAHLENKAAGD
jgi:uncharacterized protein YutE (UPF0331/DUF86 family)